MTAPTEVILSLCLAAIAAALVTWPRETSESYDKRIVLMERQAVALERLAEAFDGGEE